MFYQGSFNNCSISSQYQLLLNKFSTSNQLNLNSQSSSHFLLSKISTYQKPLPHCSGSILRKHWLFIERSFMHFTTAGYWEDIDQTLKLTKHWEITDLLFWHSSLAGYWGVRVYLDKPDCCTGIWKSVHSYTRILTLNGVWMALIIWNNKFGMVFKF